MRPILFTIAGTAIGAYTAMMALALFLSVYLGTRECEERKIPIAPLSGLFVFVMGYLGARAFHVVRVEGVGRIWRSVEFWQPGLVFHGGLIVGGLALLAILLVKRVSLLDALDIAAPYAALGEAIGRVGCLLNGCCWGTITPLPWALTYPPGSYPFDSQVDLRMLAASAQQSLPVHPTQIYMAVGLILAFVILKRSLEWSAFAGVSVLLYAVIQGILRFFVEWFRGDVTVAYLGLTWGQIISLALVLVAVAAFPLVRRRHQERWSTGKS